MKGMWPFRHVALKLWSIALAILLWMVVAGEETVERGLRVPLELQQFPEGLELKSDPPSLVDVRVRGTSGALSRMGPGDIIAMLDLRTARAGQRLYQLTPELVRTPFDVQVVQITPPSLALAFEPSATREVPVAPAVEGDPAPGFVVGHIVADPPTVEVVGPASAVQRVTEALTEPVSVAGARQDVTDAVTVGFLDSSLRLKTPLLATVRVEVRPGPVERVLGKRPIRLRGLGPGLVAEVIPADANITLRGSEQGVNSPSIEGLVPFVDLAGLGVGEYTLGVRVDAPPDAGVARIDPASIQLLIRYVTP